MFEYGCYDGVYESSGADNQHLRDFIQYPRPHSDYNQGKPFTINNQKLYYVDMNSSYMSFINGIPTDLTMQNKNYNKFMDMIHSTVNVIYENIDAILVTESDYNKLQSMNLIGDNLGQFKVEHIFNSFKYISPRHWKAVCDDGSIEKRGKW